MMTHIQKPLPPFHRLRTKPANKRTLYTSVRSMAPFIWFAMRAKPLAGSRFHSTIKFLQLNYLLSHSVSLVKLLLFQCIVSHWNRCVVGQRHWVRNFYTTSQFPTTWTIEHSHRTIIVYGIRHSVYRKITRDGWFIFLFCGDHSDHC